MTNENRGKDVHSRRDRRRAHLGSWSLCCLLSSAPLLLRSSAVCSPQLLRPSLPDPQLQLGPKPAAGAALTPPVDRDRVTVDAERGWRAQAQGRHREHAATGAHTHHLCAAAYLVLQPRQQQLVRGMETGAE